MGSGTEGDKVVVRRVEPTETRPAAATDPEATTPKNPATRSRLLATALGLSLAAPLLALLAAAHQTRPSPYGDHFTIHARVDHRVDHRVGHGVEHATKPRLRTERATVEAYDARTGEVRWTHAREGRRPLAVLPARGHAIVLWDDGLITGTTRNAVRWHRALPGAADWLAARSGVGVLRPLSHGMLAVVTPQRIVAYRTADGDLRWVLPARRGCAFAPARAVRHGTALLVAQPCPRAAAWTSQLVAVDDLGRITPHRTPLGNELPGSKGDVDHSRAGKVVARRR
jgi:hypothetical protein